MRNQVPSNKGKGKAYAFLLAHVDDEDGDCIVWPFCRDKHGRGMLGLNGENWWAHRLMCKMVNGDPPTPEHTAAHSCGKGHEGCVHPKHLDWKTQAQNLADCAAHGTLARHHSGPVGKLKPAQVEQIRLLEPTHTQGQLAAMFDVSEGAINDIWRGRTWNRPHKIVGWTEEETAMLLAGCAAGKTIPQVSGRTESAVRVRLYRLGLRGGRSRSANAQDAAQKCFYSNGER